MRNSSGRNKVWSVLVVTLGLLLVCVATWQLYGRDALAGNQQEKVAQQLLKVSPTDEPSSDEPALVTGIPTVGDYFAVITIPKLGTEWIRTVSEGTTPEILDELGVGHYEGTRYPGQAGNFALAGHSGNPRTPFRNLDSLSPGDEITVRTATENFVYQVVSEEVVDETDVETVYEVPVFGESEVGEQWLTITTCLQNGDATKRFVIYAKLKSQTQAI